SVSASILFTETGCMIRGEDLTEYENEEIGFLVYGEEVGDFTWEEFNFGMVMVCNRIMHRNGMMTKPFTLKDLYAHRYNMSFSRN
ncbi:MAG: hypothetical protein WD512_00750, partial [Candidatus Paceibacterota bacterium]